MNQYIQLFFKLQQFKRI